MSLRSQLAAQVPAGTARFTLDTIMLGGPAHPVLIVKPANDANAAWRNARFKSSGDPRLKNLGRKVTAVGEDALREHLAERLAKHVIIGWENVYDDGKPLEFNEKNCLELLSLLIERTPDGATPLSDTFELLLAFCRDLENFRDVPLAEASALGKG